MARFFKIDGGIIEMPAPRPGAFSLADVVALIGGPADVVLMHNLWVFVHKFSVPLQFPKNHIATTNLGIPIFGPCLTAEPGELGKQFFLPSPEHIDALRSEIFRFESDIMDQTIEFMEEGEHEYDPEDLVRARASGKITWSFTNEDEMEAEINQSVEEIKKKMKSLPEDKVLDYHSKMLESICDRIVEAPEEFATSPHGFVLYKNDDVIIMIPGIPSMRRRLLEKFITHYTNKEMYESCMRLREILTLFEDIDEDND